MFMKNLLLVVNFERIVIQTIKPKRCYGTNLADRSGNCCYSFFCRRYTRRKVNKGSKNPQKGQPYECGIPTNTSPWHQFSVGYYLFALLFLIFDVELVFMYPWAVVVKKIGITALIEIVIFIFILFLGFLYAHKKGALKWNN